MGPTGGTAGFCLTSPTLKHEGAGGNACLQIAMIAGAQPTQYAPAERAGRDTIRKQASKIQAEKRLRELFDAVAEVVLILNKERQVVFCNRQLLEIAGLANREAAYGKRPGEILRCSNACTDPGGCGTAEFCSTCGGVNAILLSQTGATEMKECSIQRDDSGEALDLLVKASPLEVDGELFTICAITDISHEKRRRALERIFFHDLLNTASSIKLLASPAMSVGSDKRLRPLIDRMVGEIEAQKALADAENAELLLRPEPVRSLDMLRHVRASHEPYAAETGCTVAIAPESHDLPLRTDPALLGRVLGNMAKNAVEASKKGADVLLRSEADDRGVAFSVHNPGYIPRPVQLQIFQRSFSTKGPGRGLGTYSMKLLTERYLGGKVWFDTSVERGTTFYAWHPLDMAARQGSSPV